jgi:helicase associated protein
MTTDRPENPQLATWVGKQRTNRGRLNEDQMSRLEALGFDWDPYATAWEKMFAELVQYKEAYGDCNVPAKWAENPQLGTWVGGQRTSVRKGKLPEARRRRLEKIGFQF